MAADPAQPTTRAWIYTTGGYPSCLSQASLPAPTAPLAPTQLLVRVRAAALNPVDIQLMNLPLAWSLPGLASARKTPGADYAGTVLACGSEAGRSLAPGDDVFGIHFAPPASGTLAEVVVVDVANGGAAVRKPSAWSWGAAAAVPLAWLTGRTCVARVEDYVGGEGDVGGEGGSGTVAVLGGSSATGMWTVYLARRRGWRVVATCSGRNAELVRGMGADVVVDYTEGGVRGKIERERPDAIVDCVGGTECLGVARRYVTIVGDKTERALMGGALTYLWNPQMVLRMLLGKVGWRSEAYECVNLELLERANKIQDDA
ncbi:Protein YIM1-1 [Neofusicoccum parvum]|nr:Protein YIM1-1 [Neofusicoccum parvum]